MRQLIIALAITLIVVFFGGCVRKSAPPIHVTTPVTNQVDTGNIKLDKKYSVTFPNSPPLVWQGEIDGGNADADGNLKFNKIKTVFYKKGKPVLKLTALSGTSNILNKNNVVVRLNGGIHASAVGKDIIFDADTLKWDSSTGKISVVNVRMKGMGFLHKASLMNADADLNNMKFSKNVSTEFLGDK
jgi:PBP1b-binding outer membrane lipoprotein LpoB